MHMDKRRMSTHKRRVCSALEAPLLGGRVQKEHCATKFDACRANQCCRSYEIIAAKHTLHIVDLTPHAVQSRTCTPKTRLIETPFSGTRLFSPKLDSSQRPRSTTQLPLAVETLFFHIMSEVEDTMTPASVSPLPPSKARAAPHRGILRASAPLVSDSLWAGREWLYHVNARLAQNNVSVKVPVPEGNLFGNVLRRWSKKQPDVPFESGNILSDALRRVHFRTEDLAHTYPISRTLAPGEEAATRERIESEAQARLERLCGRPWTPRELQSLYRVCCRAREDVPHSEILAVLEQASSWPQARVRALDFRDIPLARIAVPLADLLCAPTGVQALLLERCGLDSDAMRAVASAVFLGQSVHSLIVADNPNIQAQGWRSVSALIDDNRILRHLDVSHNNFSRSSLRVLLTPLAHRRSFLHSLRLDGCALRLVHLELVAEAVRASSLKHISLRQNAISSVGSQALAHMLCDWDPTALPAMEEMEQVGLVAVSTPEDLYGNESQNHVVSSLLHGTDAPGAVERAELRQTIAARAQAFQHALSEIPCFGHLLTLDLKSNGLNDNDMSGVATSLRRNRTLRVLSLADNAITHHGLALLAEALRYNTNLETLDVSANACCGPDLTGVLRLRVALAIHPHLKRVNLSGTHLAAEGALALAECLPDAENIVHLDLTKNPLGLVGMLGLAAGVRRNTSVRCIDVSLEDTPEFIQAAREVYLRCATNAQAAQDQVPPGVKIQRPLDKSELAWALHQNEQGGAADSSQPASETEPSEYSEPPDSKDGDEEDEEEHVTDLGQSEVEGVQKQDGCIKQEVGDHGAKDNERDGCRGQDLHTQHETAEYATTGKQHGNEDEAVVMPDVSTTVAPSAPDDRAQTLLTEEGAVFRAAKELMDESAQPDDQSSEELRAELLEAVKNT